MTYHISRDYTPESSGYTASKFHITSIYQLTVFLHRVLNYSIVGQTNWNINSSPFLISSGLVSGGNGAGINFGAGQTFEVSIPVGVKTVVNSAAPTGDIGRMLVLKSTTNPTKNSGLFKVTGVNTVSNRLIINYRSTDNPPVENVNSLDWWLYEMESVTTVNNIMNTDGANGPTYTGGGGSATNSRIILQSPHASAWQVRIAVEPILANASLPNISVSVGYDGNSAGDFALGGEQTHIAQFFNVLPSLGYLNTVPGCGHTNVADRMTIAGDDTGQAVFAFVRSATANELITFGIPDNEPAPVPSRANRLFCYARCTVGNGAATNNIVLKISAANNIGLTNKNGIPTLCALTGWANIDGTSLSNPITSVNGSDCPFTTTTEILPIEIWSGTLGDVALNFPNPVAGPNIFPINPTFMGTAPFIRLGRANFGDFTTSDIGNAWLHVQNGIYLQYGGPAII